MSFLIYPTIKQAPLLGALGLGGGIARSGRAYDPPGYGETAHRYWRLTIGVSGGSNPYNDHMPNSARLGYSTSNSASDVTWWKNYTSSNCSDSGTFLSGGAVETYDHGSAIAFTHFFIDSVYDGGIRSISYKVSRSDNGISFTEAWRGVMHNQTSGSWPANGSSPGGVSTCGTILAAGERFQAETSPNDGTVWSNNVSLASGSFDQPVSNAFDGYLRTSPRARTGGNAILLTLSCNITVSNFVQVFGEDGYPSNCTVTIDGTTYTSNSAHSHRFEQAGNLTQMTIVNANSNGRTYIEGMIVDGYLLKDNANGQTGWDMS